MDPFQMRRIGPPGLGDHLADDFFFAPAARLLTVAHARALAVLAEVPRFSYDFSIWAAWRFCLDE
jgi:hypothetical protein